LQKPLGGYRLAIEFSDDTIGERDFSSIVGEPGPLLEPLKDLPTSVACSSRTA
jgi:hypothetical protein